ncbi:MAG: DUF3768 domain-containing protein [Aurantimonas endophytica]|uniref:DUF3768 domain-containing protein n=1 Tax=Aurantimonas endophytica TaxID=1522175 RepID=UPI0030035FD8
MTAHTDQIRTLNDALRRDTAGTRLSTDHSAGANTGAASGDVVMTSGIAALGADFVRAVRQAVADFDAFDAANDPYDEHDFGALTVNGKSVFFEIGYYDLALTGRSADPADATITRRVLTIMLASEY